MTPHQGNLFSDAETPTIRVEQSAAPQDAAARVRALDPTCSFAVSAPAGSGKTGLLTQRVLRLLSLCDNPEEILAITFTRKAAGEMQHRILQALWNAQDKPRPGNPHDLLTWELATTVLQHDQAKGWNLLQCPQRLRVQTIDGLSSALSRQLPIANGFGVTPAPTDNPVAAYRQAVHQLLAELEKESGLRADLILLLRHLDNNLGNLEKLLMNLLARRDQWLGPILQAQHTDARHYLEQVLKDIINESLENAVELLRLHGSELALIADWAGTNLADSAPDSPLAQLRGMTSLPLPHYGDIEQWQRLATFLLTGSGTFRKSLTKNEGFPAAKENKDSAAYKNRFAELVNTLAEVQPDAAELVDALRHLPPPSYPDGQWQLLDALTRLLPRLAAQLNLVFAELGETDFTGISQSALIALGDETSPSDVALQLDYRIRHILVDEFQDTSSAQLQLLEKLTAGWQPGDGRSLFIVGDGMQSCYSFRNANVGIFLEARLNGIGSLPLEQLDLTVNFRSQSGVVEWVNSHFLNAFPAADNISCGAVKYSPSVAFKPKLADQAVNIFVSAYSTDQEENKVYYGEEPADDESSGSRYLAELQENEAIARIIVDLRSNHPDDVVALLARSRNHLQTLFTTLARHGLSWQATDIDSLAQRMAIIDLTSLARALLNPDDRIAWLAILRAPWCGLNLTDLYHIANTDLGDQNPRAKPTDFPVIWPQVKLHTLIPAISDTGRQALARFVAVIEPALVQRQRKPLRQWIEGVWLALGGPATLLDKQDIHDIPNFFALLEQHQQGGNIRDWNLFNQAINGLYAAPRQNADSKLQVMTMHKSKGLEFDHVIIPRLHKTAPNDDHALLLWRERLDKHGERQLLLGSLAPVGGDKDPLYAYMKKEIALQLHYEATRLFYVGCTRAIKKLFLFGCLARKKSDSEKETDGSLSPVEQLKAPPAKSLFSSIWAQAREQIQIIQPFESLRSVTEKSASSSLQNIELKKLLRLHPQWQVPQPGDDSLLKKYRGREYGDEENQPVAETRNAKLARHAGTIIHSCLHALVLLPASDDNRAWIEKQKAIWKILLKQAGFHNDEIESALQKIQRAIVNTINDSHGKWLLDNSHKDSACELAIIHKEGNKVDLKLRENIIDRTFVENGIRWIIDYKSSEPGSHQTKTEFFAQEMASYTSQLKRYRACFNALGETAIKTALYFPLLDDGERFFEIDE